MRITLNREKAEMRLNIELADTDLLKWDETMMRFADRNMSANAYLNEIDKNFEEFRYHNATKLSNYNAKTVRDLVIGLNAKPTPLIIQYIDKYHDRLFHQMHRWLMEQKEITERLLNI